MSYFTRSEDVGDEEADAADRAFGPTIVGFMNRFADPAMERRYLAAMAPHGQRRLTSLLWVALCLTLTRIGGPILGLFADPAAGPATLPRALQVLICVSLLVVLRKARPAQVLDALSLGFVVSYLMLRCWLLPFMDADGSVAMIVGTVALAYFGVPLRVAILAPILLVGSGAMLAVWFIHSPGSSVAAKFQIAEWLIVINLLGVVAMRLMRLTLRRQWSLSQAMRHLATHDGLTGIANRRRYDQVLDRDWRRCREQLLDMSLVLLDIDFFKLLNDGIGHDAGDDCLRELAALLQRCVAAPGTLVARTGGEEFACLLPGIGEHGARDIADRIAAALRKERMPHPASPVSPYVTISLGVATARGDDEVTLRELTGLADRLLYAAKSGGRDCLRQQLVGQDVFSMAPAA